MIVRLTLHDSTKYETEIIGFDLTAYIADINTNPHQMLQFGDKGIAKHMIKIVETVEEVVEPTV